MSDAENRTTAMEETALEDFDVETQELTPEQVENIARRAGKAVGELSQEELDELLTETRDFQFVDHTREIDLRHLQKK